MYGTPALNLARALEGHPDGHHRDSLRYCDNACDRYCLYRHGWILRID